MRKTKEETEKTKCDLMRVAVKVFNENGYAATRLEDVASAANVSRGAIYYHFGTKADMFKAIVLENKDQNTNLIDKFISNFKGNNLEALREVFKLYISRIENEEFFRDVEILLFKTELSGELFEIEEYFKKESRVGLEKLRNILEAGIAEGSISKDLDVDAFAFALMGYFHGILALGVLNTDLLSLKNKAQELCNFIFKSCEP